MTDGKTRTSWTSRATERVNELLAMTWVDGLWDNELFNLFNNNFPIFPRRNRRLEQEGDRTEAVLVRHYFRGQSFPFLPQPPGELLEVKPRVSFLPERRSQ